MFPPWAPFFFVASFPAAFALPPGSARLRARLVCVSACVYSGWACAFLCFSGGFDSLPKIETATIMPAKNATITAR